MSDFYTPEQTAQLTEMYYFGLRPVSMAKAVDKSIPSVKAKMMEMVTKRFQREIAAMDAVDLSVWTYIGHSSEKTGWVWQDDDAAPLTLDQCRKLYDAGYLRMMQKRVGDRMVQFVRRTATQEYVRPWFTTHEMAAV